MAKKNNLIHLTYPGVVDNPKDTETLILDELMRKFQSAKRYLRERKFEGKNRKEAVNLAKPLFIPNSRYMRDAFLEAEASISSQEELLPTYIAQNDIKIDKLEKQIENLAKSKKKKDIERMKYKQSKLAKLKKKNWFYQYHIDNGTVPKMVDGSKQLFRDLKNKKITKAEWKDKRSNAIFSRGEKSKGGNENIKLSYIGGNLFEMKVLNPLSDKKGDRLHFQVRIPEKFVLLIASYLETGESYTVRILRINGKYEVRITLDEENHLSPSFEKGIAGLDMNPDNFAVTIVYPNGVFGKQKIHKTAFKNVACQQSLISLILY